MRQPKVVMPPEIDESKYIKSEMLIDHGKNGVTRVIMYDPCTTPEKQEKRRLALEVLINDLVRKGEIRL